MRLVIGSLFAVTFGLMPALVIDGTITMLAVVAGSSTCRLLSRKGRLSRDRIVQRIRGEGGKMDRIDEVRKIRGAELVATERPYAVMLPRRVVDQHGIGAVGRP